MLWHRTSLRVPSAKNFGTRNSEMPSRSRGRIRQACKNEMNDIIGKIVLAVGDEDLLAR